MQNQINSATHTPSAYNVIGGTGGWGTGSSGCVNCYLSYQNNQSIAATPGVTYSGYETGQIICSIGGAIFATLLKARQIERARWRERGVDNLPFSSAQQTAREEEQKMWTGKGILLGIGLFAVGSVVYLYLMIRGSSAQATGITAIAGWTVMNPLYWLSFVASLILGCAIARFWPTSLRR